MTPLELELRFERGSTPGSYRVVARGPGGAGASGRFTDPFSQLQLENFVLRMGRRSGVRRIESPESELAKEFGTQLFGAVFEHEDVREAYRSSLQEARHNRSPLRVTLSLTGTPELLRLPWEYLYDDPAFLAISRWTPIVRRLDVGTPRPPLDLTLPLRILSLVSAPSDVEQIDAERERVRLTTALDPLVKAGGVSIDWVEEATLLGLTRMLDDHDYHVLHFIGHGGFLESMDDGVLLLEDEEGRSDRVSGEQLGQILRDQLTMRLVVLNACEGARSSADDPFSGVAARLIRHGIPSVIGMQFEITDRAAILFASDFYTAIANGRPVDSAMARARRAIYADHNFLEWGTPVLFMRVQDGRLFEVAPHAPIEPPSHDALLETAVHVGLNVTEEEADATAAPAPQSSRARTLSHEPPASIVGSPGEETTPRTGTPKPSVQAPAPRAKPRPPREEPALTREQPEPMERLVNPPLPSDRARRPRPQPEPARPRPPRPRPPVEPRPRREDRPPWALIGVALAAIAAVVLAIAMLDGDGGNGDGSNGDGGRDGGGGASAAPTVVGLVSMPDVFARPLAEALEAARQAGFTREPRVEHVCSGTLENRPGLVRDVLIDVGAEPGVPSDPADRLVGSPADTLRSQLQVSPDTPLHIKVATGEAC